ncbi:hypothetical protein [Actinomycetospora aeridis]|uniref:Uncharacterized protein n=1 Tax=Actinomycetospora aeridis TaxID=3129231 RepID=A0ABU8N0A0_9PSEU
MQLSGPTLNNLYPAAWGQFTRPGERQCGVVMNRGLDGAPETEMEVVDVRLVDQRPGTVFSLFDDFDDLENDCTTRPLEFDAAVRVCTDSTPPVVLPPPVDGAGTGCRMGLTIDETAARTENWFARLLVEVEMSCTSPALRPCDAEEVRELEPTPAEPVVVRMTHDTRVFACFALPPGTPEPPECQEARSSGGWLPVSDR